MCCFSAIIFFDFGVVVSIHLSCSHIAVAGTSAMGELGNLILIKCPRCQTGAFFLPFPLPSESALSVQ